MLLCCVIMSIISDIIFLLVFNIYRVYIFISLNRSSWQKYDNLMYSVNPFFLWRFDVGHENKTYHSEKM